MLSHFLQLIFPNQCYGCGELCPAQLSHICLECRNELPRYFWNRQDDNHIEKLFWGRVKLEKAASFLTFEKDSKVQELIHSLKYRGKKEIGKSLGEFAAAEMKPMGFFEGIDALIPVPIHPLKEKKRGYNQSFYIAEGISEITELPVEKNIISKVIHTSSQTKKGKFKRWLNVASTFELLDQQKMENDHLLLIDDVITTGSTVEACALELQKINNIKISLLTMACTY